MTPNRTTRFALILAAAATLFAPLALSAQPHGRGPGHGPGGPGAWSHRGPGPAGALHMFLHLDLSDEQQASIREILEARGDNRAELATGLARAREALREAARPDALDEGAVRAAAAELGVLEGEMAIHRARLMQEVRALLTPEQLVRADEMRERRHEARERFGAGREERRERWRDSRGGGPGSR